MEGRMTVLEQPPTHPTAIRARRIGSERFRPLAADSAGAPRLFEGAVCGRDLTTVVIALPDRMQTGHPHSVLYIASRDLDRQALPLVEAIDELVARRLIPPVVTVFVNRCDELLLPALVRLIDRHLPTMPTHDARSLIGIGSGSFATFAVGVCMPEVFGSVHSWYGTADAELVSRVISALGGQAGAQAQRLFLACDMCGGRASEAAVQIADELHRLHRPFVLSQAGRAPGLAPWSVFLPNALRFALRGSPWPQ